MQDCLGGRCRRSSGEEEASSACEASPPQRDQAQVFQVCIISGPVLGKVRRHAHFEDCYF
jgi:hypothetical protein